MELEIIWEDAHLIAVNKPSGLLIHHGWESKETVLVDLVREQIQHAVFPVHRLDRATSGIILFGKTREATRLLNQLFSERRIQKRYLAWVKGVPVEPQCIDRPLSKRAKTKAKHNPLLPALTFFRCLATQERTSVIEAFPRTGRQHQIRRHLRAATFPILGDRRYGFRRATTEIRIETGLARLALHAVSLTFPHPVSGEELHLVANLPEDLRRPLLRKGFLPEELKNWVGSRNTSWLEAWEEPREKELGLSANLENEPTNT